MDEKIKLKKKVEIEPEKTELSWAEKEKARLEAIDFTIKDKYSHLTHAEKMLRLNPLN